MILKNLKYEANYFQIVKMFFKIFLLSIVSTFTFGLCGYLPINEQIKTTLKNIKSDENNIELDGEITFNQYFKEYWLPVILPITIGVITLYIFLICTLLSSISLQKMILIVYLAFFPTLIFVQAYTYKKMINLILNNFILKIRDK